VPAREVLAANIEVALTPRGTSIVWPMCSTTRPPRGDEVGCFGRQHFFYFAPDPHGHGPFASASSSIDHRR
jgi:hypothetical protein